MHKSSFNGVNLNEIRLDIEDELLSIQSYDEEFDDNLDVDEIKVELDDKVRSNITQSGFNSKFDSGNSNSNPFSMIRSPGMSIATNF